MDMPDGFFNLSDEDYERLRNAYKTIKHNIRREKELQLNVGYRVDCISNRAKVREKSQTWCTGISCSNCAMSYKNARRLIENETEQE